MRPGFVMTSSGSEAPWKVRPMSREPPHVLIADDEARRASSSFRYVTIAVLCCLGVTLSVGAFCLTRNDERQRRSDRFDADARDRVAAIREQINAHALILESLRALYAADDDKEISRREFRAFCTPLLASHQDIQALEWIPRVPGSRRREYEAAARADGLEAFQIIERSSQGHLVPAARREEHFPVYFVEPRKGNEAAIGFDLGSGPMRLEALSRSRDTGRMVATASITLVQETEHQAGFLVFMPVYDSNATVETVAQRRVHLKGFILGVFRVGDLVEDALANIAPAGIDLELHDDRGLPQPSVLHYHVSPASTRPANVPRYAGAAQADGLKYQETIDVGGRYWTAVCAPTPTFLAAYTTTYPWGVLGAGLMFTLLACAYLASATRHAARQHQLVGQLSDSNEALRKEVSERKEAEKSLRKSEENLSTIFDASPLGMLLMDEKATIVRINDVAAKLINKSSAEMINRQLGDALGCIHSADSPEGCGSGPACQTCPVRDAIEGVLESGQAVRGFEVQPTLIVDGAQVAPWLELNIEPLTIQVKRHAIAAIANITDRKRLELKLVHMASHDPLTGLSNRRLFEEALARALARAKRGTPSVVLIFDVDRFKLINDTLGHAAGDEALIQMTRLVQEQLRAEDILARVGGDEFAALLEGITMGQALVVAERARRAVAGYAFVPGRDTRLSLSIGVSLIGPEDDIASALMAADAAMYEAKESGRNRVVCRHYGMAAVR